MPGIIQTALQRGTLRLAYATVDFESAIRGLLVQPLLERGVSPTRVDEIVASVLQRESAGSTCAGPVALPHARISGVSEIIAGLGVNPHGIYPGGDARVMLAFVSPTENAGDHLRFLSAAAKMFRDPAVIRQLQDAADAGGVLRIVDGR